MQKKNASLPKPIEETLLLYTHTNTFLPVTMDNPVNRFTTLLICVLPNVSLRCGDAFMSDINKILIQTHTIPQKSRYKRPLMMLLSTCSKCNSCSHIFNIHPHPHVPGGPRETQTVHNKRSSHDPPPGRFSSDHN